MKSLRQQLRHPKPANRASALKELVRQKGAAALPIVEQFAQNDPDPRIRKMAASMQQNLTQSAPRKRADTSASDAPEILAPKAKNERFATRDTAIYESPMNKKRFSAGKRLPFIIFIVTIIIAGALIVYGRYSYLQQSGTFFLRNLPEPAWMPQNAAAYAGDLDGNYYKHRLNDRTFLYVLEPDGPPPTDEGYGLIVALPGSGGNGQDMIPIGFRTQPRGAILVAPSFSRIHNEFGGYDMDYMVNEINAIVRHVDQYYDLDPDRLMLYGFSMGGMVTYQFTARYTRPFKVAGVFGAREFSPMPPRNSPVEYVVMTGSEDYRAPEARDFIRLMRERGTPVWYGEIQHGRGHSMSEAMYDTLFDLYDTLD